MDDGEPDEEFLDDFGTRRLDDATLQMMLGRARAGSDVHLRRLVKEVQLWRQIAPALLDRVAPSGTPVDESDALIKLARFIIRGDGKIAG